MLSFIEIIFIIVLFVKISGLNEKISKLEKNQLNQGKINSSAQQNTIVKTISEAPQPPLSSNLVVNTSVPAAVSYSQPEKKRDDSNNVVSDFGNWFKRDWPLKIGAILLIIGFGWLLAYAFANEWIGPTGQVSLGIFLSMIFVGIGYWKIRTSVSQGGSFLVVGSTGIIMTIFAAQNIYSMFPPVLALIGIFIASLFVTVASLLYKSKKMATIGLILSSLAPVMLGSDSSLSSLGLSFYVLVVVVSSIWVVFLTGWREMTLVSLIIASFYSMVFFSQSNQDNQYAILFLNYILVVIFYLTNVACLIFYKDKSPITDLVCACLNSVFFLGLTLAILPNDLHVLAIIFAALLSAISSFVVYIITGRKESFLVYAAIGTVLLGIATTIQLQDRPDLLIIAYIFEISAITILSYLLSRGGELVKYVYWLYIIPILMSLGYMSSNAWSVISDRGVLPSDFFILSILGCALAFIGLFIWYKNKIQGFTDKFFVGESMIIVGSIYAYIIIWLFTHGAIAEDAATFISMTLYTIIGLTMYSIGGIKNNKVLTIYGTTLMVFVVVRLLLVDIWSMESIVSRFVTFFGVGLLFMSTAFLVKNKKPIK